MYLGIDIGTTFSKISTIYLSKPFVLHLPNEYGIPSVFYYDKENGILIGNDALDAGQGMAAANLVSEVKMKLSQSFVLDGRTFTSKEIVSEICKVLVKRGQQIARTRGISEAIEGVVISVPAKFGMQERQLIYGAVKMSFPNMDVKIQDIAKEPVAAALSYFHETLQNNTNVLVYDLGGGTCDVALVRSNDSLTERFEVIDSDMIRVGGRNWDEAVGDYLIEAVENKNKIVVKGNPAYEEKIRRAAMDVKHKLSDPFNERAIARVEINGRITAIPITRTLFEEITTHLLNETLECLQDVYDRNLFECQVSDIICVGGSSNMPQIEAGIKQKFPQCRVQIHEPEHAVVNGNAVYADLLKGRTGNGLVLKDVSSFSYGVEVYDDYHKDPNHLIISNIILRGSELPAEKSKIYFPTNDKQKEVWFEVYESEIGENKYEKTEENKRSVGCVILALSKGADASKPITCNMKLNHAGILEVTATDFKGKKVEASFQLREL